MLSLSLVGSDVLSVVVAVVVPAVVSIVSPAEPEPPIVVDVLVSVVDPADVDPVNEPTLVELDSVPLAPSSPEVHPASKSMVVAVKKDEHERRDIDIRASSSTR